MLELLCLGGGLVVIVVGAWLLVGGTLGGILVAASVKIELDAHKRGEARHLRWYEVAGAFAFVFGLMWVMHKLGFMG